jgi:hypothetical protein
MGMTDTERIDVLAEIERSYVELRAVLDSLSLDDMQRPATVGHWDGKDVLSHIAAWLVEGTRHINARDAGEDDAIPPHSEFDAWNELQVMKTRDWTVEQVRSFFESAYREYVQIVSTSKTVSPGFATGLSSHHFGEHIDQFRAMRSDRS